MSEQYFVEITDTISVPTPDAERVGPFYRYEDAEGWIDGTVETYVEHLSDRHQEWLLEQDGDTADLDGDPRVEWDAASEKRVVYDPAGTLVATYAITWEEDEDGVSEST